MTETSHTPGPWIWRGKDGSLRQKGEPPYAYGKTVLRADYEYDSGVDTIVSDADARLIAAAPDMLDALTHIEAALVAGGDELTWGRSKFIDIARAAIAKATAP